MKKERCDTKWPVYRIERKKGVRYYAVFSPTHGKQVTKTLKTKNEAILWLKQQHIAVDSTSDDAPSGHRFETVKWLCDYWLKNYAVLYKSESSVYRDKAYMRKQIIPHLGSTRLEELTSRRLEVWMADLRQKLGPKTCNDALGLVQKMFNDAIRWKFVSANPALSVPRFKIAEKDFKCWSHDEKAKFLRYLHKHQPDQFPLFLAALLTGLRLGELRGLEWHCLDLERGTLTAKQSYCIRENAIVSHTKSYKVRRLPLSKQLLECLIEEKKKSRTSRVFINFDFTKGARGCKRLCKLAGVPEIRFHDLRHVFASHLAMSGLSLYKLQKLLGHQSVTMTERYSHLLPDTLTGLTEVLSVSMEEDVG